jgi:hypothetical protein
MGSGRPKTESAVAAAVTAWLEGEGHEVFSEVSIAWKLRAGAGDVGDGRADLVAIRGGELAVVECKASLSFDLFAQCERWLDYANRIWLAVPVAKASRGRSEAFRIARDFYGFGVLEVRDAVPGERSPIVIRAAAVLKEERDHALRTSLRSEHKTHAKAGSNTGGHFTSFKETCQALAGYVSKHPACTLDEALGAIEHHYKTKASAANSLGPWIRKGKVAGVYQGWKGRLWSDPKSASVQQRSS